MSKDVEMKKNNHRVGGIALGVCIGALLFIGIRLYSMADEKQSVLAESEEIFKNSMIAIEEQTEGNLLEDVANWTQEGISSMKEKAGSNKKEEEQNEIEEKETVAIEESVEAVTAVEEDAIEEKATEAEATASDEIKPEEEPEVQEESSEQNSKYLVLGDQNVNVRQQPSTTGAKVGSVAPGSQVTVDKQVDGWSHIVGEVEGYVIGSALRKIN